MTVRIVSAMSSARAHAAAKGRTCSEVSVPSTHATSRRTDNGSGQLCGRGDHPGLSAIGPRATTESFVR